jgi:lipopolysaccharide biosynthesis glycosyltransferase
MKGDSYLPGIFTSIFSVLRTNPLADLVVMITPDVSGKARNILKKVATHLFEIDYITFTSKPLKTKRQRQLYETWIESSYTKWNALALPYSKVILLDGDTINTTNTDELFLLDAPAMSYANPFIKPLGKLESYYEGSTGRDGYPIHGTKILPEIINKILYKGDSLVPMSSPTLLEPNLDEFREYIKIISNMQPFGFSECYNGFDEQSIVYFNSICKNKSITAIHQRYNFIGWKDGFLFKGDVPRIIHFFSDTKPWVTNYDTYPDIVCWYKMAALAIEYATITPDDINLTMLNVDNAVKSDDTFIKKYIRVNSIIDVHDILSKVY